MLQHVNPAKFQPCSRAVTNFSSRRGIEKSSWGTKKSGAAAELAGGMLKLQLFVGCRT